MIAHAQRGCRRRPAGTDGGAAAVEFALLLPIVLIVIFGIIDFGRAFNAQLALNAGAREGARVLALNTGDATSATQNGATPLMNVSVSPISCTTSTDSYASVTASYAFSYITPLSPLMQLIGASALTSPITLHATGTFRCS